MSTLPRGSSTHSYRRLSQGLHMMQLASLVLMFLAGCRVQSPPGRGTGGPAAELAAELPGATIGMIAVDVDSGEELISVNADTLLVPASNVKLMTTAAALEMLGPRYRFWTEAGLVRHAGDDAEDLLLTFGGDPSIGDPLGMCTDELFSSIGDALVGKGVTRLTGDVVADDSRFAGEDYCPDWQLGEVSTLYAAPVSAASIEDNSLVVHLQAAADGSVVSRAAVPYPVETAVTISDVTALAAPRIAPGEPAVVTGSLAAGDVVDVFIPIERPAVFWAERLRDYLVSRGIEVDGVAQQRSAAVAGEAKDILVSWLSPPLSEIVRETNRKSRNQWAELLCKELGHEVSGEGTFAGGAEAVRYFLERAGVSEGEVSLVDGSGLARTNLVTPRAIVTLLLHMRHAPQWMDFAGSLAVAGSEGTLRRRFRGTPLDGRVIAKTGTLRHVSALSGYMWLPDRELAFAVIVNGRMVEASEAASDIDHALLTLAQMEEHWNDE